MLLQMDYSISGGGSQENQSSAHEIVIMKPGCHKTLLADPVFHNGLQNEIFQFHIQFKTVIAERTAGEVFNVRLQEFLPASRADQKTFITAALRVVEHSEIVLFACIR